MGKLLANTIRVKSATKSEQYSSFLNMVESKYLQGNIVEKAMIQKIGREGIIDISSATSMNIFERFVQPIIEPIMKQNIGKFLGKADAYPYLVQRDFGLEQAFSSFIKKWTGVSIAVDQMFVAPNGVYGSYKSILLSSQKKIVMVPETIHQINKACFSSLGKRVVEIPNVLETGLIDLTALDASLHRYAAHTVCVYLYHSKPVAPINKSYYLKLAAVLKKHAVLGVLDIDSWYTNHIAGVVPWLPLEIPQLRKQCLFLFTMTKEIGAPGLRVGVGVGPSEVVAHIKKFQQVSLEMTSPVTRYITELILQHVDMKQIKRELQERMKILVEGLRSLGFKVMYPPSGVNLFLHVPISFEATEDVLPDHLFSYYVLTRAGVLLRPASNHGHRMNHWVRFVIGQSAPKITQAVHRLQKAGIRGDMKMSAELIVEYKNFMQTTKE